MSADQKHSGSSPFNIWKEREKGSAARDLNTSQGPSPTKEKKGPASPVYQTSTSRTANDKERPTGARSKTQGAGTLPAPIKTNDVTGNGAKSGSPQARTTPPETHETEHKQVKGPTAAVQAMHQRANSSPSTTTPPSAGFSQEHGTEHDSPRGRAKYAGVPPIEGDMALLSITSPKRERDLSSRPGEKTQITPRSKQRLDQEKKEKKEARRARRDAKSPSRRDAKSPSRDEEGTKSPKGSRTDKKREHAKDKQDKKEKKLRKKALKTSKAAPGTTPSASEPVSDSKKLLDMMMGSGDAPAAGQPAAAPASGGLEERIEKDRRADRKRNKRWSLESGVADVNITPNKDGKKEKKEKAADLGTNGGTAQRVKDKKREHRKSADFELLKNKKKMSRRASTTVLLEARGAAATEDGTRYSGLNQDRYFKGKTKYGEFWGVLDGHSPLGEIAADIGCKSFTTYLAKLLRKISRDSGTLDMQAEMEKIFLKVHEDIIFTYSGLPQTYRYPIKGTFQTFHLCPPSRPRFYESPIVGKMAVEYGTVATVAIYSPKTNVITCANVGDSKGLLISQEDGNFFAQSLTADHNCFNADEIERIKQEGKAKINDNGYLYIDGPSPLVGHQIAITRALGHKFFQSYSVSPIPYTVSIPLNDTHKFVVLASDGVWDSLTEEDLVYIVIESDTEATAAKSLVDQALARSTEPHSHDNSTSIVVFLNPTSQ